MRDFGLTVDLLLVDGLDAGVVRVRVREIREVERIQRVARVRHQYRPDAVHLGRCISVLPWPPRRQLGRAQHRGVCIVELLGRTHGEVGTRR